MAIESIFDARRTAWDGLGTSVSAAPTSEDAIRLAGLDWSVIQQKLYTQEGLLVSGNYANIRDTDRSVLGVVGAKYQIVQNIDAFKFTDALLGEGVQYETAGSLNGGKTVWMLARMPQKYKILGDEVTPYIVFTNTHDGSGSVKVAMTPIRVVCQNTLNLALKRAKRTWTTRHTAGIEYKMNEALETLEFSKKYMEAVNDTFEELYKVKLTDFTVRSMINNIVPVSEDMGKTQKENNEKIRDDILWRFKEAPDLRELEYTGARLIQAVSDTASHIEPFRKTTNYAENRFRKAIEGNDLLNRALDVVKAG